MLIILTNLKSFRASVVTPYENEALADSDDDEKSDIEDEDGLSPETLESRYQGEVNVND